MKDHVKEQLVWDPALSNRYCPSCRITILRGFRKGKRGARKYFCLLCGQWYTQQQLDKRDAAETPRESP
jgi:hypothetical protein